MELLIDNQTIDITDSNDTSLQVIIERILLDLKEKNRVISEIYLDGKTLAGWDDPQLVQLTVGECGSVRIVSDEPRLLAHKVLYEIARYMPQIQEALVQTASQFQSRQEGEALQSLQKIMATWAELFQGFQSAVVVTGLDASSVTVKGKTFDQINLDIHQLLDSSSELINNQQYLELSDILEYELAPQMPLLEEAIYQLVKQLEKEVH